MRYYSLVFFALISTISFSQDPHKFTAEIDHFKELDKSLNYDEVVLFTGSSSVRFWSTLEADYPPLNVVNRGFGGSQFSDLIQYLPRHIFIYEGDNDVYAEKSTSEIMTDAKSLVSKIRKSLPRSHIYFISPKPSIARWNFKNEYLELNQSMKSWTDEDELLHFINVWIPMCDAEGIVLKDIFIEDDLHMNEKGYDIWREVIRPFVIGVKKGG